MKGLAPSLDAAIEATGAVPRALDVLAGLALQAPGDEGRDPHVWLDPALARDIVALVRDRLTAIDPTGASTFATNAEDLAQRLDALDAEYRAGLADCARRDFVTSHVAFAYLADRYALQQVAIAGLSPDQEPSPQQLQDVIEFAQEHDVKVIFFEDLVSPELAETVAAEVGARTLVLSPLEGLSEEQQATGDDYFSVARANLANLRDALECE
jgi:zinc transport system substrate-binding protein